MLNWDILQGRYTSISLSPFELIKNPSLLIDELLRTPTRTPSGLSVGRFAGLITSWDKASETVPSLLLGYGPATSQGSRYDFLQSSLYEELRLAGSRTSQATTSLLEWGLIGTCAYLVLLIYIWWQSEKAFHNHQDVFWKATAFGQMILGILMVGLTVYTTTWVATASAFLFWYMGGVLYRYDIATTETIGKPKSI